MDSDRDNARLANEELEHCEVSRTSDNAPHVPSAATSVVSMSNEKLQVDLLYVGGLIALRAMDVLSPFSPLKTNAFKKSSGSSGCVLQCLDGCPSTA